MARNQDFFITIFSNLILQFVTAICGFILPPLIIKTFGSEINGLVSSISQFIAYLNLVEAGIGAASITALYKPLAEENIKKISGILSAVKKFYLKSGIFFSFGIVVLAFFYPLFAKGEVEKVTSFFMVLILGIAGVAEFFLIGKYRVLLTADKKLYVVSFLQSVAIVLNTIVTVLLIKFNFGILTVKFISSLIYLLRFVFLASYIHKNYKKISYKEIPDTKEICQSKNALVHQISGFIVYNSPVIVLTVFCGLKEVSIYSVYMLIFTAVNNIASTFINGLQAFFGESMVKDSGDKLRHLFSIYETFFFLFAFLLYSCTVILIMPFMKLYTANMADADYIQSDLAVLLTVAGLLTNLRVPGGQIINAAGHFKKTQWRSLMEAAINIFTSILFTLKFGILGVALGNIVSSFYRGVDVIIYTNRHILIRKNFFSFIKIFLYALIFSLLIFICSKIQFNYYSWRNWCINAVCIVALCSIPIFVISFIFIKKGGMIKR